MVRYILKRSAQLLFLLWAVSTLIFFLIHLIPGDPTTGILGEGAGAGEIRELKTQLNLDKPIIEQYFLFNRNLMNRSFGASLYNHKPVLDNILAYLPNTLYLSTASMLLAVLFSFPLGIWAAFREGAWIDTAVTAASSAGLAAPNFLLGPLLIILFSVTLRLFPVSGSGGFKYIILPALTLGTSMSALLTRIVRTAAGSELKKPYILLARAKGLSHTAVFFKHLLKNILIPVVTTVGLQLGALLTGAVITETIFSWQGMGALLIQSIHRRDYPMVQGIIVFITFTYLTINLLVDLSYFFFDPRIRHELKKA